METLKEKRWTVFFIYLITFLSAVGYAFVIYINSSFLQKFVDKEYIGFIYGVGSIITLITLSNISAILNKFGHWKTTIGIVSLEFLSIFGAAFIDFIGEKNTYYNYYFSIFAILSFLSFSLSAILMRLSLDVYLEKFSNNKETGKARGKFLTTINFAIMLSPYLVGKILTNGDYWRVYLSSSIIFIPAILVAIFGLKKVRDVHYHDAPFLIGLKKIWANNDIRNIFISAFLLELFYSWMTIYTPIYLNTVMGFSWADIGLMFSIMLTPFVLFQLPLGKIADEYIGEKEILTLGFFITGFSTLCLSFINKPDFLFWVAILFMTRVGASAIEIMNETYFFKKVSAEDSDMMGFFRNASPLAYIIGPLFASIFVMIFDFKYIFLVLGAIMLYGIRHSLAIEDTM